MMLFSKPKEVDSSPRQPKSTRSKALSSLIGGALDGVASRRKKNVNGGLNKVVIEDSNTSVSEASGPSPPILASTSASGYREVEPEVEPETETQVDLAPPGLISVTSTTSTTTSVTTNTTCCASDNGCTAAVPQITVTVNEYTAPSSPDLIRRSFSTSDCKTTLLSAKPEWAKSQGESVKACLGVLGKLPGGDEQAIKDEEDEEKEQQDHDSNIADHEKSSDCRILKSSVRTFSSSSSTSTSTSRYADLQTLVNSRKRSSVLTEGNGTSNGNGSGTSPKLVKKRSRHGDDSDGADAAVAAAVEQVRYVSFPSLVDEVDSLDG